jgi:hypothetical protein
MACPFSLMPLSDSMPRGLLDVDIASAGVVGAWLGFAIWATYSVFALGRIQIYAENGPIEFIQSCLLALACAIYLVTLLVQKRPDKLILLSCSLLCYGFVVRELDVETFDLPRVLILIGSGVGRNTTLTTAIVAIGLYAVLFDFTYYRKAAAAFARSRPGILLMTAGLFLVIADLIEKSKPMAHHAFAEEMVELFAYVLILLSSIIATRGVIQR